MAGGWNTPSWMGGNPALGETFVNGKTQEVARGLLAACDRLGVPRQMVRTAAKGFNVPSEVYDEYLRHDTTDDYGI